jgi:hypothetical protein
MEEQIKELEKIYTEVMEEMQKKKGAISKPFAKSIIKKVVLIITQIAESVDDKSAEKAASIYDDNINLMKLLGTMSGVGVENKDFDTLKQAKEKIISKMGKSLESPKKSSKSPKEVIDQVLNSFKTFFNDIENAIEEASKSPQKKTIENCIDMFNSFSRFLKKAETHGFVKSDVPKEILDKYDQIRDTIVAMKDKNIHAMEMEGANEEQLGGIHDIKDISFRGLMQEDDKEKLEDELIDLHQELKSADEQKKKEIEERIKHLKHKLEASIRRR